MVCLKLWKSDVVRAEALEMVCLKLWKSDVVRAEAILQQTVKVAMLVAVVSSGYGRIHQSGQIVKKQQALDRAGIWSRRLRVRYHQEYSQDC